MKTHHYSIERQSKQHALLFTLVRRIAHGSHRRWYDLFHLFRQPAPDVVGR